jgi:peptidoglycan/xylan/chitin deacetylase (PgdA/CDA1 family)
MTTTAATLHILTFHALDELPPSVVSLSPAVFRNGIAKLLESGYHTISLMDAVDCLRQRKPFPNRAFVITFDDGYRTVYRQAFPVLQRHSLSATVFLTVGEKGKASPEGRLPSLKDRDMLGWAEIREMQRGGVIFAAHTLTHPDLTRLATDRIQAEICESKAVIEDALGAAVTSFAYPYGRYNRHIREIVEQHFACACVDRLGLVTLRSDLWTLERVDAYCLRKAWGFELMVTSMFPWYLSTYRMLRRVRMTLESRRRP